MASGNPLLNAVNRIGLVPQIIIGLMLGVLVGSISPKAGLGAGLLGELFVGALKAVAPVLVFVLVTAALVQYRKGGEAKIKPIIILYLVGTFAAAAVAVAAAAKREAYGKETAIEPVTLKDGDWVFIEGDERRGWFFDRSHMKRNADGSVSYWQLILYNNLGRAQFAEAMKNADYEHLGYTMQRRVLSPKKDAISTYEILAYDGDNALITESSREGHRAVIRANTMTEKERDAVRQELRRKK